MKNLLAVMLPEAFKINLSFWFQGPVSILNQHPLIEEGKNMATGKVEAKKKLILQARHVTLWWLLCNKKLSRHFILDVFLFFYFHWYFAFLAYYKFCYCFCHFNCYHYCYIFSYSLTSFCFTNALAT